FCKSSLADEGSIGAQVPLAVDAVEAVHVPRYTLPAAVGRRIALSCPVGGQRPGIPCRWVPVPRVAPCGRGRLVVKRRDETLGRADQGRRALPARHRARQGSLTCKIQVCRACFLPTPGTALSVIASRTRVSFFGGRWSPPHTYRINTQTERRHVMSVN